MHDSAFSPFVVITDRHRLDIMPHIPSWPKKTIIIIRDYDHPHRREYCADIIKSARRYGHYVVIANDPELAARLRADGIHLPEYQAKRIMHWRQKYPQWLITHACHSLPSLLAAQGQGVDIILYSSVFPTLSHPGQPALGIMQLRKNIQEIQCDAMIYGLGGIDGGNIKLLKDSGLSGVAGIGLAAVL